MVWFKRIGSVLVSTLLVACGGASFNLGLEEDSFSQQSKTKSVPIDILWVIDNSGSMETSQNMVADNFSSFIDKFKQTKFDYRIAITTTEAFRSLPLFNHGLQYSRFVDGTAQTSYTGIKVIRPDTPNIEDVFNVNVRQGIMGSGDERGLQSLEAVFENLDNHQDFFREGAFLSIIFVSDEEDFSWNGTDNIQHLPNGSPNVLTDARLTPVSYYLDYLDQKTNSTGNSRNYSVNTIGIFTQECLQQLSTSFNGRRFTERYVALTDATGGVKANLCDDFSDVLSGISDSILEFSTRFFLNRPADPDTIEVFVDDRLVPDEGWTYKAEEQSITFHGQYIPSEDASIRVRFQPLTVK